MLGRILLFVLPLLLRCCDAELSQLLQFDPTLLSATQLDVIARAERGEADALNILGKALIMDNRSVFGLPDPALAARLFEEAATRGNHVQAARNLGGLLATGKGSLKRAPRKALHWFQLAAQQGDAASAYNAGLLLTQGHNPSNPADVAVHVKQRLDADPISALEYFRLAEQISYPDVASRQIYNDAQISCRFLSDTLAARIQSPGLDAASLRRVFLASFPFLNSASIEASGVGSVESESSHNEVLTAEFSQGIAALAEYNLIFKESKGALPSAAYSQMLLVVEKFSSILDSTQHHDSLSNLQLFLLLDVLQDMLGPLTGRRPTDVSLLEKAARSTEALALSYYCRGSYASREADAGGCFNGAVSAAVSYYRRLSRLVGEAGLVDAALAGADRVFQLARDHARETTSATLYQRQAQTPRVYYPGLTGRPWWEPHDFEIVRALESEYKKNKQGFLNELESVRRLKEGGLRRGSSLSYGAPSDEGMTAGIERIFTSYISVSSEDDQGAGGWSEFGPLYDGVSWSGEKCSKVPLLCEVLKKSIVGELCGGGVGGKFTASEIEGMCGSDTLITILRLKPGTHIHAHCGTTNRRLIMHFALVGPEHVQFRVGDEDGSDGGGWRGYLGDGRALVFDDSFEHEVKHLGERERFVVLAVLRHPDVPAPAP